MGAAVLVVVLLAAVPSPTRGQGLPTVYLYLNDLADPPVLLQDEADSIDGLCYDVDRLTSAEIAVLIVNTTLPLGMDTFAVQTFEANGIGKAGKDNGLLLVVSTDEQQWRVEVGYGLEGVLNDAKVGAFGRAYLVPNLTEGFYYDGIYGLVLALGQEILDSYDPNASTPTEPQLWGIDWKAFVIAAAIFIGVAVLTKGRSVLWLGNFVTRGKFGGGRSGGGGARGKW
jgi:uncharacterized protein